MFFFAFFSLPRGGVIFLSSNLLCKKLRREWGGCQFSFFFIIFFLNKNRMEVVPARQINKKLINKKPWIYFSMNKNLDIKSDRIDWTSKAIWSCWRCCSRKKRDGDGATTQASSRKSSFFLPMWWSQISFLF